MSESDRLFFVEYMDDKMLRIGEMFTSLREDIAWMKPKVARIDAIEQDIHIMKLALTETNRDLGKTNQNLERTRKDLAQTNKDLAATNQEIRRQNNRHERRFKQLEQR